MDAEEFLAVDDAVAIGVPVEGISAVEVGFITIGDTIAIGVRVGGIQTKARLEVVGRVVRILIGRAGDRRVGRLRCAFRVRCWRGAGGRSRRPAPAPLPGRSLSLLDLGADRCRRSPGRPEIRRPVHVPVGAAGVVETTGPCAWAGQHRQCHQTHSETDGRDDEPLHGRPSRAGFGGWTHATNRSCTRAGGPRVPSLSTCGWWAAFPSQQPPTARSPHWRTSATPCSRTQAL